MQFGVNLFFAARDCLVETVVAMMIPDLEAIFYIKTPPIMESRGSLYAASERYTTVLFGSLDDSACLKTFLALINKLS